jgi:hypothetical protein
MPTDQRLEIHLRRRFVERAAAHRPRLAGNLKQLGAVGPVVRPLTATSRQAFVKVGITQGSTTGKHLSYLTHEKSHAQQDATLFGPATADTAAFIQAAQQDPHQFRIVVQVPEHRALNRTRYIALFMAQVDKDLGRPLDWLAAHHYDTPYPHTHIVLRGRDRDGKDLYMEKHYLTHGLRTRAAEVLTWMLGPVLYRQQEQDQEQRIQSAREVYDGVIRSLDDPDMPARLQASERPQAEMLAAARTRVEQQATLSPLPGGDRAQPDPVTALASLTARLTVLHQALQAQQQAQRRGGWGHGG